MHYIYNFTSQLIAKGYHLRLDLKGLSSPRLLKQTEGNWDDGMTPQFWGLHPETNADVTPQKIGLEDDFPFSIG